MLLEPPNQLPLLVALVGQISRSICRSRLWNPREIPQSCMEEFIPIQPVLRGLSILPATAVDAAVALPPQSIRIETVGLGDRSGSGSGSSCIDEVSFKIKDTLLFCSRDRSRTTWILLSCICT